MSPRHSSESTPRPSPGVQLRQVARRVHFLAGILVAPFVLMLCLTGLVYVFSPQIHNDLYAGQFYVDQVGDAPRPVSEQVAAALAGHPEAELRSVVPPPEPDRTTRVNLSVPGLVDPGAARTVFVDPYTNYISGELTTVDDRMPANIWLRDLHANLHLGEAGRLYAETAASWLPAIVVGGLVLWVGKQGRRPRTTGEVLLPALRGKGAQTRMRSLHGPLGLWLSVGLLAIAATGLIMSPLAGRGLFDAREPTLAAAPVAVPPDAEPAGLDRILEVARAQGLSGELKVTPPAVPDRPFTVVETSPGLPVQKDGIAVDPYTTEITERIGWADYPLLAKLRVLGVDAHTGALFGLANQIVLTLLVVGAIVLIVGGYRMWWMRSPYREPLLSVPPTALGRLAWPAGIALALVTVVLGWLMPTFGISLVLFVAADLAINAVRRRAERVRRSVAAGVLLLASILFAVAVLANVSSSGGPDGGEPPRDGRAPDTVFAQPAPGGRAGPIDEPDVVPEVRARTPATGSADQATAESHDRDEGADDDAPVSAGGESGGTEDGVAEARRPPVTAPVDGGGDGSDAPPAPPPPAAVDGLVGALTEVTKPVTTFLSGVVHSVVGAVGSGG